LPELPEVEVVRRGLAAHVVGRRVSSVEVLHERAVRRHGAGSRDFASQLSGRTIAAASRRGKYLWLPLTDGAERPDTAAIAHLGMSGQLLVEDESAPDELHLRVRLRFDDGGPQLRFVDQRTFGGLAVADLVDDDAGGRVPQPFAHIARDPLDPAFDEDATIRRIRAKSSQVKRVLLDQTVISGVGNIYADEALWRASINGAKLANRLTVKETRALLDLAREVMSEALDQGGTSFDALYVNVNGQSGYFDRSLAAYGQEGRPCPRCGTPITRVAFMGRSSYFCPTCQRVPRIRRSTER
jgi:formamidopyrimidine-DNA glycosylase